MTIRKTEIVNLLSLGIIIGFIVGLILSINKIIANMYIQYKMSRLIVLSFQESLNKWMILIVIISAALIVIILVALIIIKAILKSRLKFYLSNVIEVQIKDKNKAKTMLACIVVCSVFFFYGGWIINRYFLPEKFHPLSILGNLGILVFTIFLGWFLAKVIWENILRRIALALIISLAILNFCIVIDSKIHNPKGPNVILIIVDTLRADHLSCYGYNRNSSPKIDEFSMNSVVFRNAISAAPWTTPSIASIFTSQYPAKLGFEDEPVILNDIFLTLAEIFRENSYKTKGIISHTLISSELGFNQGFDKYDEENAKGHGHISSPSIAQKAISFLEKNKNKKFFLFLHFFDPHFDFILHEKFNYYPDYNGPLFSGQSIKKLLAKAPSMSSDDVKYIKALYDSEISFTDEFIGNILDKVKEFDLYNDTIIIFTADHGEEFLERGDYWIGHEKKLYQEQIHVPLIIKLAGNNNKKTLNEYVGLIDLMPTIVDFVGLRIPNEYKYEGKVLDLSNVEELKSKIIFSETKRNASLQSVIWKGWKLIHDPEMNLKNLFNLEKDLAEFKNVIRENKILLKSFEEILQGWNNYVKLEKSQVKAQKPKFTEEQKQQLRSLGYVK